jgi:hypothetical protein
MNESLVARPACGPAVPCGLRLHATALPPYCALTLGQNRHLSTFLHVGARIAWSS